MAAAANIVELYTDDDDDDDDSDVHRLIMTWTNICKAWKPIIHQLYFVECVPQQQQQQQRQWYTQYQFCKYKKKKLLCAVVTSMFH